MAIFYFQANVVQRSKGKSAVAAAAYRAGLKLEDKRTGLTYDYTYRKDVDARFLFGWEGSREQLWNAAEAAERRKDSTVAREYIVALPIELNAHKRQELAIELSKTIITRYGVAVDLCFHGTNSINPHIHILTTTREVCPIYGELGAKSVADISNEARKKRSLPGYKQQLESLKILWCGLVNNALKMNGFDTEISHKSFKERGIYNRIPQIKTYGNPERVAVNDRIKKYNKLKDQLDILYHEIYMEELEQKYEQKYESYLEQIEPPTPPSPPTPEPINLSRHNDLSSSERLMAEFMAEWAAEDAAAEKNLAAYLSSQANNRNNGPSF